MRRVVLESLLVAVVGAVLTVGWFGAPAADTVCGAEGAGFAWRVGQLGEWWAGAAALGDDHGVPVPISGLPWVGAGALLAPLLGMGGAWLAVMAVAVGAGAAALWGFSRAAGAGPLAAGLAVAVGVAPPVLAEGLAAGGPDLAVVPLVAAALALSPRPERWARIVGFAAVLACGFCDARTGAIAGIAALAAGGGAPALVAALVATGTGAAAVATRGALDPVDLAAPFVTLRPEAVAPGLAVLAAAVWGVGDVKLRRAARVAFVFALGPVLAAFGDPLTVGAAAVPLPAAALAAFAPHGAGWGGALVVAGVAAALGLGRLAAPRAALLLAPLALFEAARTVDERPTCLSLDAPVAVRALKERTGGVLNLPVRAELELGAIGAPAGAHALYLAQRRHHGRALATGPAPLGAADPLYGEPAVVLSIGADRLYLPPTRPGEVLRGLGITEIVVHRSLFAPATLALVDPVLFKLYGAPQRDHAGDVDLYRVSPEGPVRAPFAERLRGAEAPPPAGWLDLAAYIAGLSPVAPAGAGQAPDDAEAPAARVPAGEAGASGASGEPATGGKPGRPAGTPRGPPLKERRAPRGASSPG